MTVLSRERFPVYRLSSARPNAYIPRGRDNSRIITPSYSQIIQRRQFDRTIRIGKVGHIPSQGGVPGGQGGSIAYCDGANAFSEDADD